MPTPELTKDALEFIGKMQHKHAKQVLLRILLLCNDPFPQDSKTIHGGPEGSYRVDSGEYRIVYRVEDDSLQILLVGKRSDDEVYKQLIRKH